MSFKEIAGNKIYFRYADCEVGQILVEGKFIRDFQGRYGVQYEFEHKTGEIHVLNSSGQLNYKMEFVKPGELVQVIYDGMITLEKGAMAGKSAHQFKLLRNDDDQMAEALSSGPDETDGLDEFDAM